MQERVKPPKKAVNLSIDAEFRAEAKAAGINSSAALEAALQGALKERRRQKWRDDDKAATESMNRYVAKHGLLPDRHRTR